MTPVHEPGRMLSARFYAEVVAPAVPHRHAAALLGPGSDVLGFDTARSTDHDWGPRCQVFVAEDDVDEVRERVRRSLPEEYAGCRSPSVGTAARENRASRCRPGRAG